ncbi:hypothetical protein J7L60_00990 [Candidatus Bathyarchaeota archaeon]|nr:hypothetical protein [Candidatus Bathyarchaeota archaeon]
MVLRRLSERSELEKIRRGYIINVHSSRAYIHLPTCITVPWMNPKRRGRGGVYHSESLEEAIQWIREEGLRQFPCRLCLEPLTYRPKPSRLPF